MGRGAWSRVRLGLHLLGVIMRVFSLITSFLCHGDFTHLTFRFLKGRLTLQFMNIT
ncbi:hypothetical protein M6B38_322070 [Iris pallida]|uniref:Uncharacterized protein n=1 Tax=Iris pallida TaxID=29817 RepID=A0AAX6HAM8_IRIPA|nr:hypothetical protein M6B38_322070 [Iris pallida]